MFLYKTHIKLQSLPGSSGDIGTKSSQQVKANEAAPMNGITKPLLNGHAKQTKKGDANNLTILKVVHFLFLISFSGLEFSLPFTAAIYGRKLEHSSPSALNGRLLSMMGLIASVLQGTIVRRLPPLVVIRLGVIICALSLFLLGRASSLTGLYSAGALLAVTSATVVKGINSLGSLEAREAERGAVLGHLRSWGQVGRALGSMLLCSLFWWAGREIAYTTGGGMMVGVGIIVFCLLRSPSTH